MENEKKLSSIKFSVEEIEELKSIIRIARGTGSYDYVSNPNQFSIYRKLGLGTTIGCSKCLNKEQWSEAYDHMSSNYFISSSHEVELEYCNHHATWMTNPYDGRLKDIEIKLLGHEYSHKDEERMIIEKFFGEEMSDIVNTQFRCGIHIGKLKLIATKI